MTDEKTFRAFIDKLNVPALSDIDWQTPARKIRRKLHQASHAIEADRPEMATISHLSIPGPGGPIQARQYTPLGAGIGPGPAIAYFHGGGFVLGDLDAFDMVCMRLADGARARVISFDYRLAPDHTFPAAHDDAMACWNWLQENAESLGMDRDRIAVAGDSAGGNLAAFIAQDTNRRKAPGPAFQLLLYPLVQFADIRAKKMTVQESGFFFSANVFEFFRDNYLGAGTDRMDPRVSPLFASDESFAALPAAHIVLCGWDPLKDEGRAYADKMASFGVPVTVREHPEMVHGFMNLTALSDTIKGAVRDAGRVTGRALGALEATE